jgi:hypothetical protein
MAGNDLDIFGGDFASRPMSAQDTFTNRSPEIAAFDAALAFVRDHVDHYQRLVERTAEDHRNVLVWYGMGGIGKTRLAHELQGRLDDGNCVGALERRIVVSLDLHEPQALDFEALVLTVRGAMGTQLGQLPAFDIGLAVYWDRQHPGIELKAFLGRSSLLSKWSGQVGLADQVQAVLESLLDAPPGLVGTARRIGVAATKLVRAAIRRHDVLRNCPLFPGYLDLDPDQMLVQLPSLLGWDLSRAQQKDGADVAVFVDSAEQMQKFVERSGDIEDRIARMAYGMPTALFVFTGQNRLTWADDRRRASMRFAGDSTWPNLAAGYSGADPRQHLLQGLSQHDREAFLVSRLLVSGCPAMSDALRGAVAQASEGLPLYLDLSAEHFMELHRRGVEPQPTDFPRGLPGVLVRVIEDLESAERDLLRAAALTGRFDDDLLRSAVPAVRDADRARFLQRDFVQWRPAAWLPYSLHETLRSSVRECDNETLQPWSDREWATAGQRAVDDVGCRIEHDLADFERADLGKLAESFRVGLSAAAELRQPPDWLVLVGERLLMGARWDQVAGASTEAGSERTPTFVLALVMHALAVRRDAPQESTVHVLDDALAEGLLPPLATSFTRLWLAKELVGARRLVDAETTYCDILTTEGPYARNAAKDLALLDIACGRFTAADDRLARLGTVPLEAYWHDVSQGELLLYHGRFDEAITRLSGALQSPVVMWSNPYRIGAERWLAMAQAYTSPVDALRTIDDAYVRASETGEPAYPLADCESTRVLALAALDRVTDAEEALKRSDTLLRAAQDEVNSTHSRVAEVYLACRLGDTQRARKARTRLHELFLKRGSHGHWLAITAVWVEQQIHTRQENDRPDIDWLDPYDVVLDRWRQRAPVQ